MAAAGCDGYLGECPAQQIEFGVVFSVQFPKIYPFNGQNDFTKVADGRKNFGLKNSFATFPHICGSETNTGSFYMAARILLYKNTKK